MLFRVIIIAVFRYMTVMRISDSDFDLLFSL